jgi:hypothetical protein
MYTGKKREPGLSPTNSKREYQYRPGHLTMKKLLNHTQNGLRVELQRLRSPIKKMKKSAKNIN